MPPLQLRQEFPTLKAFKEALHAWAIEAHFEPRILKSDTGRVRVGCKRDPNCPFVVRCNWERKTGREPLARVTVLRDRHTCLNGLEWRGAQVGAMNGMNGQVGGDGMMAGLGGAVHVPVQPPPGLEIRQDEDGNIVGGARVLGPINPPRMQSTSDHAQNAGILPVLPKVQRNSASRLPFLLEILPRLMSITKETTPVEIRECLLRKYGAEVHLQQCRRAKTEILKKQNGEGGAEVPDGLENGQNQVAPQEMRAQSGQSIDAIGSETNDPHQQLFADMNATPNQSPHTFQLHATTGVVTPAIQTKSTVALNAVGEPPVRCPYCVNHRWMKSIKDAVEHMSMHVVV